MKAPQLFKLKGTSNNLVSQRNFEPSSETRKPSQKPGGVAGALRRGLLAKADTVAAEGSKLQPKGVIRGTLKNGLTVILSPSHRSSVVSFQLWAQVGSIDECPEEAGMSHVLEHMLFKGTPQRPVGRIAQEVEGAGGEINAYTSFDETVYYITIPSRYATTALDILADAVQNSAIDPHELAREVEVVVEEIARTEDSPFRMASEKLFEIAFPTHPYGRPIIGTRSSVRAFSRPQILNFIRRWYVPSNLTLIGAGDFDPQLLSREIETLFGGLPTREVNHPIPSPESPPRGARALIHRMAAKAAYAQIGLVIPSADHKDIPSLDLLGHILGGGAASRLELDIRAKRGWVNAIYTSVFTARQGGLFNIGITCEPTRLEKVMASVGCHLRRIASEPPSPEETAKAKLSLKAERIYEQESVQAIARKLGHFHCIAGGLETEEGYYRGIEAATAEDLMTVAATYLNLSRLSMAVALPSDQLKGLGVEALTQAVAPEVLRPSSPRQRTAGDQLPHLQRLTPSVSLITKYDPSVPIVAMRALVPAGVRCETERTNGISTLVASLLTKGTERWNVDAIARLSDGLAGGVEGVVGSHSLGLRGTFIAEKWIEGIDLFCELLLHPSFPHAEIEKGKKQQLQAIRREDDSLPTVAFRHFREALYQRHPYRLSPLGTPTSLRQMDRRHLVDFYTGLLGNPNMVLAAVGSVDPEVLADALAERLQPTIRPSGGASPRIPPEPRMHAPRLTSVRRPDRTQAHIVLGFLGTTILNRDRYALEVLSLILGGQGGRLFVELRDREALAYAVMASSQEGIEPGSFTIYIGVDKAKIDPAVSGILRILKRLKSEPPTEEEIDRARQYLVGSYDIELQRLASVAATLASNQLHGIPLDEFHLYPKKIGAVTRDRVFEVTQKYIDLDAYVLSIVHP